MNTETERLVYHSLNLPIEKLREYNVEKYHFLSGEHLPGLDEQQ